jgi:hypothetical protein
MPSRIIGVSIAGHVILLAALLLVGIPPAPAGIAALLGLSLLLDLLVWSALSRR